MVHIHKYKEVYRFGSIKKLAVIIFIASLANALYGTIWAAYLENLVHNSSTVGFINSFLTVMAFISYFIFIPIIEKYDKAKLFLIAMFFVATSYFLLYLSDNIFLVILFATMLTVSASLKITSFGILVKDNSPRKKLSRNEGLIYTFMNSAWVIGPLLASFIILKYQDKNIFLISAILTIITLLVFLKFNFKDVKGKSKSDNNTLKNFIGFFKSKDRIIAYSLGAGVTTWWSLIFIFIPLLILDSGLKEQWIGIFLFAVAIPLIILEIPMSKIVGRKGFRKMFMISYIFVAVIALICFFVTQIYTILLLLILASFGLAILEPNTEAYFFDILKGKERYHYYGPYNTTVDVGQFLGMITSSVILLFLPFKYVFLVYSGWMFFFFLLSFKTKDIIESNK